MPPRIRLAKPEEAARLSSLAFESKQSWGYPPVVLETWREALTITARQIEAMTTYVATLADDVVGFYQLSNDEQVELEHMWVHPAHMRQGVGRALLSHAVDSARRIGAKQLHIDADPHAVRFYSACGARRIGSIPAPIDGSPLRERILFAIDC